MPKVKSVNRDLMKGRPLTVEEFERMLADQALGKVLFKHSGRGVKKVADTQRFASWRHLLRGLWLGGLRIGEAMNLSWDNPEKMMVDTSIPGSVFLRIAHGGQKANRDELLRSHRSLKSSFSRRRTAVERALCSIPRGNAATAVSPRSKPSGSLPASGKLRTWSPIRPKAKQQPHTTCDGRLVTVGRLESCPRRCRF